MRFGVFEYGDLGSVCGPSNKKSTEPGQLYRQASVPQQGLHLDRRCVQDALVRVNQGDIDPVHLDGLVQR